MSKVKAYQQYLNSLGADLEVDGAWGNETQTAYEKLVKGKDTQKKDDKKPKPRDQSFPVTLAEIGSHKAPDRRMFKQNGASIFMNLRYYRDIRDQQNLYTPNQWYSKILGTYEWKSFRDAVINRDKCTCLVCGGAEEETVPFNLNYAIDLVIID